MSGRTRGGAPFPRAPEERWTLPGAFPRQAQAALAPPLPALVRMQRTIGNAQVQRLLSGPPAGGGAASPAVEEEIGRARGGGGALDEGVRRSMEAAFGADFGGVRVHTGPRADALSRALGARAFTTGRDVFFRAGEPAPSSPAGRELLAHELAHVVQQGGAAPPAGPLTVGPADDACEREAAHAARAVAEGGREGASVSAPAASGAVQRDLALAPPGRLAEPAALTPEEVQEAIDFNSARFDTHSIRAIQDVIGAAVTGVMDADTVQSLVSWQADFRLEADGQVGLQTLRTLCQELIAEEQHDQAIQLIIDGHDLRTRGLTSIRFDPTVTDNAVTEGSVRGNSTVRIGPTGFLQGYEGLVHTIAHELEHVRQNRAGIVDIPLSEFLGESVEILSRGMLPEDLSGFMDDARRAIDSWNAMSATHRRRNRARFIEVREAVRARFNAVPAGSRAAGHQAIVDDFDAVTP